MVTSYEIKKEHPDKQEKLVCITACLVIATPSVISLFNHTIRSFIVLPFKMDTIFIYSIFILIALLSVKTILIRSKLSSLIIIYVLLLAYLISFLLNSYYYDYYISIGVDFLINTVPWLIVAFSVQDFMLYKKYLYISALIILASFIFNLFVFRVEMVNEQVYSQYQTYVLLPVAIILADALYEKISILNIGLLILAIILMLSMGARGPLACVLLFFILKNLVLFRFDLKKAFINNIPIILLISVVNIFFDKIIINLLIIFEKMNLSTRTINKIIEGTLFEDRSRTLLIKHSLELIGNNSFIGVGLGKDRILLASRMRSTDLLSEAVGWYPHNIFIELLLQFGVIIGFAFILYIIWHLFISVFKSNLKFRVDVICIFIGIGFFPLLFSGSYVNSPLFFALMGFCLNKEHLSINKNDTKEHI